ncbi:pantetheine-phosphate adenylyltransferase [Corynebacterium genitalium ATCC 33030]|uniref:Phosphopantetheine adenylyltransferase n=1 Tax=Corynebacterium genitalium ATCC 33030 TaxID=585529 RepID=D7WD53_9CORY|nr:MULTISPECIES: pantetheine-phosphate adenylyltransferase [Corynebacterium]EFK54084.1 pantetheine-phosphate adenylyltransferase [Corynebacterium genitalium ATCC 33030]MCQ4618147.1 pantetheine-phosphate adenylyltransferase [Corynebacterium pseudogenitalium]MCQ4625090.1 pantetheine-phosphate adenylyltransferase [Corynebacterium sp. CCUG 69979]UUA90381.1 pantetheine-phosphate adenylyltransferase [Corynebacterium genitalium ATCC 33030]
MTKAVCPGSFDPVTNGHLDIFTRAARSFDEVTVLVTGNPNKQSGLFSIDERMDLIREVTSHIPNITVDTWGGLLVDYTTAHNIGALVKGLRSSLDYDYELPMAQMNRRLSGVDTFFLMTDEKYGYISSSLCKEVAKYGGDLKGLVPDPVFEAMNQKFSGTT